MYHWPAQNWPNGTMIDVYDWDNRNYLGQIPQAPVTYNVIGNMNEFQVSITETTFGGLSDLATQPGAIIDYGSLIYITLSRAKTAREAIQVMTSLVAQYGYASDGESFSIGDPTEAWVLEMIGKGAYGLGAVWVAQRVPDGYICAHANQARIRTFPLNDSNNCVYAPDVVTFAQDRGYYPKNGSAAQFSFSDTYDPVTFGSARACEVRVWSFFNRVSTDMGQYLDYVQGYNLTNRMPLWIKPNRQIGVYDIQDWMGDHLEGTWFDFSQDVGAESYNTPYRWRPLSWPYNGNTYVNERSAGTQQSAFSVVCQMRSWYPNAIGGIIWFGTDDADSVVHIPMYSVSRRTPLPYTCHNPEPTNPNGDMLSFSFESAFWVFNLVTNFVYPRYGQMHPEVDNKIASYRSYFESEVPAIDQAALALYKINQTQAIDFLTQFSVSTGETVVKEWLDFFKYLFTKYMDGNIKTPNPDSRNPNLAQPGYSNAWYGRIVAETGTHYMEPASAGFGATKFKKFKGV